MTYFFAAVSTRQNLEGCEEFCLAGFPDTRNGVWAYVDIDIGDFVSFLYGGRAHGLYKVVKKEVLKKPKLLTFWEPITTKKRVIYFPYLLRLKPVRELDEPLARSEFLYITENLLRRGGIRKSHFQADQTTLQNVSQMGKISGRKPKVLPLKQYKTFTPRFVKGRAKANPPEVNQFVEKILQSLLRQHLSKPDIFEAFLKQMDLRDLLGIKFEILGELALERGYVDLFIKESEPRGIVKKIAVEVKTGKIGVGDVKQLSAYIDELGNECIAGVLIGKQIARNVTCPPNQNIYFWKYTFGELKLEKPHTFKELLSTIRLLSA